MAAPVLSVDSVFKTYAVRQKQRGEDVQALRGVSISVGPGELLVLLGPSGCGKTTLLRSVAGLEQPAQGEIRIGGEVVFSSARGIEASPDQRDVGMMFQSYALWPHLSAIENVMYPLRIRRRRSKPDARAAGQKMLDSLGIGHLAQRYPGELSGGQAQRVALARALAGEPAVVLFDEPLSNVDAQVRRRLRAELRETKRATGFGGIYVTHDQQEAMELADRLAVMKDGKILQIGSPREIYETPQSREVAAFVGEANFLAGAATPQADGRLRVGLDLGAVISIELPSKTPVGSASRGAICFRPENVRVLAAGDDAPANTLAAAGIVKDVAYRGEAVEVSLEVAADCVVHAKVAGASGLTIAPGDRAWFAVDLERIGWIADASSGT